MQPREANLWATMRGHFRPRGVHLVRVENGVEEGTPDLNYCKAGREGWVELKCTHLPKRPTTGVKVEHFTEEQRGWANKRAVHGGRCFMWLAIGNHRALFKAPYPPKFLAGHTVAQLKRYALLWYDTPRDVNWIYVGHALWARPY